MLKFQKTNQEKFVSNLKKDAISVNLKKEVVQHLIENDDLQDIRQCVPDFWEMENFSEYRFSSRWSTKDLFSIEHLKYARICKIGEGTFGKVYKAQSRENGLEIVAIKAVKNLVPGLGIPLRALREISILKRLKHENILRFIEICTTGDVSVFTIVTEFCDFELNDILIRTKLIFTPSDIKMLMEHLFKGIAYMHENNVLHRDLKTTNILVTREGILKIADMGLARQLGAQENMRHNCFTSVVVTLWYRSPELLLGDKNYGPPIDMWAAGCIMAEMWTRTPIMQGCSEQHQLNAISHLCGSITAQVWPDVLKLKLFHELKLPLNMHNKVKQKLQPHTKDMCASRLIETLLKLDPLKRATAQQALQHDYFLRKPVKSTPADMRDKLSLLFSHKTELYPNIQRKREEDHMLVRERVF